MRTQTAILVVLLLAVVVALVFRLVDSGAFADRWVYLSARADSALSVQSRSKFNKFAPFHLKYPRKSRSVVVEINSADSVALCSVYGIGPVFSSRIIARRKALGGFHSLDQLTEIRGITREVLDSVRKNFRLDSCLIQKINVNFVGSNVFEAHPYITSSMARRIERERMKGGLLSNQKDLTDRDILLPKEASRIAPYLSFDKQTKTEKNAYNAN